MIIVDELKRMAAQDPDKYPLVFHPTNEHAVKWTGALEDVLMEWIGYDIDVPNEELQFPTLIPLRGRMGWPTFDVVIFEEGEELYVEFLDGGLILSFQSSHGVSRLRSKRFTWAQIIPTNGGDR